MVAGELCFYKEKFGFYLPFCMSFLISIIQKGQRVIIERTVASPCSSPLCSPSSRTHKSVKMDMSKLPKIRDEERESQFGYVHGVSGPGLLAHMNIHHYINIKVGYSCFSYSFLTSCKLFNFIHTDCTLCSCLQWWQPRPWREQPCTSWSVSATVSWWERLSGWRETWPPSRCTRRHVSFWPRDLPVPAVTWYFLLIHCVAALWCTFFQDNQFDSIRGHKWGKREEWVMRGWVCV